MGRPRSFDEHSVVAAASAAFSALGYEGTSVDDLLQATGLHRGSLYQAFGSKRGLFLAALRAHLPAPTDPGATTRGRTGDGADEALLDLLLVATLELAPRDEEVRALVARALTQRTGSKQTGSEHTGSEHAALLLGRRLLARAHLDPDPPSRRDPTP